MNKLSTTRRRWFRLIEDNNENILTNFLRKLRVIDTGTFIQFGKDSSEQYYWWCREKEQRIRKSEARYESKHRDSKSMKPIRPTKQRKF